MIADVTSTDADKRQRTFDSLLRSKRPPSAAVLAAVVESFRYENGYGLPVPVAFDTKQVTILRRTAPRSTGVIIDGLRSENVHVRRNCAYTLGVLKDPSTFPALWRMAQQEMAILEQHPNDQSPEAAAFRAGVFALLNVDATRAARSLANEVLHANTDTRKELAMTALDQALQRPAECADISSEPCKRKLAQLATDDLASSRHANAVRQ